MKARTRLCSGRFHKGAGLLHPFLATDAALESEVVFYPGLIRGGPCCNLGIGPDAQSVQDFGDAGSNAGNGGQIIAATVGLFDLLGLLAF